jgi:uncharacterized protein (TIGR00255 family)
MACESMTGWSSKEFVVSGRVFSIELRSVNHRFLDISVRVPSELSSLETDIQKKIRATLKRGKVDVTVRLHRSEGGAETVTYNQTRLEQYANILSEVPEKYFSQKAREEILQSLFLRNDVLASSQEDFQIQEEQKNEILSSIHEAIQNLHQMRLREGENLQKELELQLEQFLSILGSMETRVPEVQHIQRERLQGRIHEVLKQTQVPEEKILQEVAFIVDRADIREELTRAQSHIELFKEALKIGEGKRIDFLTQEFLREMNTIGSKSVDAEMTRFVIDGKVVIERIREQVQNVA